MRARVVTVVCIGLVGVGLSPLMGGCGGAGGGSGGGGGAGPIAYRSPEDAGAATIRVERVDGNSGNVSVQYSSANGSAAAPADYTSATGTLSWSNGNTGALTFSVPLVNDGVTEGPETVVLSLQNVTGGATLGEPDTVELTIVDPAGTSGDTIRFTSANYTVAENDLSGAATLWIERVGSGTSTVTVNYTTSPGTATLGADYTAPLSNTVMWSNADQGAQPIGVPILDDGGPNEPVETILVTLSNPTGGAVLGTPSTATVSIVDAAGTVRFSSPTYSVSESGFATIELERVGGSRGPLTVSYATSNGTASASDYTAQSGTFSWTNGEGGSKTFAVPTTDDGPANEPDETVRLAITGPVSTPSTATLTITDRAGTLEFSADSYRVYENLPAATLTVRRVDGNRGNVSVDYATSNGSALAGTHYTSRSGTLFWSNGNAGAQSISVPLADDGVPLDGTQTFHLTLSSPQGGAAIGAPASVPVTIVDRAGTIRFAP
jgi:hypothetical protein